MPGSYAVAQTQVGLALETTRGQAEAPAFWLPTMSPKYKPDLTLIEDKTLQGSMVDTYDLVRGLRYDSHGWSSHPYLDSFPNLLRAEFGSPDTVTAAPATTTLAAAAAAGATSVTVAAAGEADSWVVIDTGNLLETHYVTAASTVAPYTLTLATPLIYAHADGATVSGLVKHQFSLLNNAGEGNQPPSYTLTDYDGEEWRQLTAAQLDKLTIKGNATGLVEYDCTWFANAAVAPSPTPSPSFTGIQAPPGWSITVSIAGNYLTYTEDWEFDFGRGVKPIPALTGTQAYYEYFAGPMAPTAKLTVVETAGAPELTQYLAGETIPIEFTLYDLKTGFALHIRSSNAKFKTGELVRSKEWVEATLDIDLLPSVNDATAGGVSPCLVTVANAQTTAF